MDRHVGRYPPRDDMGSPFGNMDECVFPLQKSQRVFFKGNSAGKIKAENRIFH
jgi:hypothetical protein